MSKNEIKVREIAPNEIKLDDRNLNRHTDKGRDLVNKSFSELGAGRSGVSDRNGKMIAGNLSVETAIEKGLKIVEVETEGDTYIVVKRKDLDLDSTTDNRARKLALADNSTAAVSLDWNWEEMQTQAEEFGFELGEWGVEVPDETIVPEVEEDNFNPIEGVETDIVAGDVFEFRKGDLCHRLMCGDSTDSDAVAKLMGGKTANMVFTDPPHEVEQENFISYMDLFCNGVKFVLHNDKYLAQLAAQYIDRFERFFVHDFIFHIGGGNRFFTQNDLIACFDYNSDGYNNLQDGFSTVIRKMTERQKGTNNLTHPHAKPVYLVEQFITHFSKEGCLVLDFYAGSGTTMVTAHQLNRNCYMMEINEKTTQLVVDRMKSLDDFEIYKNDVKTT